MNKKAKQKTILFLIGLACLLLTIYSASAEWNTGTTGIEAHFPLDENLTDMTGNYNAYNAGAFSNSTGNRSGSYLFNGTGSHINTTIGLSDFAYTDLTISAWAKPATLTKQNSITGMWDLNTPINSTVDLRITRCDAGNYNKAAFMVKGNGSNGSFVQSCGTNNLQENEWYNFILAINSSHIILYKNGEVEINESNTMHGSFAGGVRDFYIGAKHHIYQDFTDPFDGFIDEVTYFNFTFNGSQVTDWYNCGTPRTYPFNESGVGNCSGGDGGGDVSTNQVKQTLGNTQEGQNLRKGCDITSEDAQQIGQTFKINGTGNVTVDSISLQLEKVNDGGLTEVYFYTQESNSPTGSPIGDSAQFNNSIIPLYTDGDAPHNFTSNFTGVQPVLDRGTTYFMLLCSNDTDVNVRPYGSSTNQYPDGLARYNIEGGGTTWADTNTISDVYFIMNFTNLTSPEPETTCIPPIGKDWYVNFGDNCNINNYTTINLSGYDIEIGGDCGNFTFENLTIDVDQIRINESATRCNYYKRKNLEIY